MFLGKGGYELDRVPRMDIRTKRIYDDPEPGDGTRVLVDRLWPRGVSKDDAQLDACVKSVAPSIELREWYDHDVERWDQFRERYRAELDEMEDEIDQLLEFASSGTLTVLYAAKDREHNNAVVLKRYLEERTA
jgi:uncharacterized protein YeaO (DUF488 family)